MCVQSSPLTLCPQIKSVTIAISNTVVFLFTTDSFVGQSKATLPCNPRGYQERIWLPLLEKSNRVLIFLHHFQLLMIFHRLLTARTKLQVLVCFVSTVSSIKLSLHQSKRFRVEEEILFHGFKATSFSILEKPDRNTWRKMKSWAESDWQLRSILFDFICIWCFLANVLARRFKHLAK